MHIFQIPSQDKVSNDYTIGVIDCSGSMQSNWKWLAQHWNLFIPSENSKIITFDTNAKIPADNRLNEDIYKHGGGGTLITTGFVKLDAELKTLPQGSNVTIVFISDGEDNKMDTLPARMSELNGNDGTRRINFICIGVGPGFPTFISMKLREKYHNGDETLPAIFLIEHISEKAYTIKFEAIKPFLSVGKKRTVKPSVCVFPWREYSSNPFERTWVMTEAESVEIDGEKLDVREHHLNLRGINELFRSWNQMINLESMNEGEKVDVRAKKTLALMDAILEELKISKGIDVFSKAKDQKFDTLFQKVQFTVNKRNFERTVWFYDDVKKIASGDTAGALSDFEAAKRIGLGTIVGKYQQKAFALKKISAEEFDKIKCEFKELLTKSPVADKQNPCPLRKLLREPDLDKAVDLCKNQLELFECFPLHGHPVRIIRNPTGHIDANNVDIRFAGLNVNLELQDIIQEQGGTLNVQADGKTENVNCVMPLFSSDDADLIPFLNSRLYKLLMSFNLIRDPDELLDQSFVCMLTGLFGYAIKQSPPNQNLLNKILETLSLCKHVVPEGDLISNPFTGSTMDLTQEYDSDKNFKRAEALKIMLHVYGLHGQNLINNIQKKELVMNLIASEVNASVKLDPTKKNEVFSYTIVDEKDEESAEVTLIKKLRTLFPKIRSMGHLNKFIWTEILNATVNKDITINFVASKIGKLLSADGYQLYQTFQKLLDIPELSDLELEVAVLAGITANNNLSFDFNDTAGFESAKSEVKKGIKAKLNQEIDKNNPKASTGKGAKGKKGKKDTHAKEIKITCNKKDPLYLAAYPTIEKEFKQFFKEIHKEVIPQSKADMESYCKNHGINFKNIKFNVHSLLPVRVCGATGCHFYMKEAKRLDSHLGIWGISLPKGFHLLVKENRSKPAKEIYEILSNVHYTLKNGKSESFDPSKFEKSPEEVLSYIENVQKAYNKLV